MPDSTKSLRTSNQELKNQLEVGRKDLKRLEEGVRFSLTKLTQLMAALAACTKPEEVDKVLEEFQEYSYAFNVIILGVPELGPTESAEDTSNLCLKIFDALGAHATLSDIDVAHRVAVTDASRTCSKPIVCKFIRRFARNREMAVRTEACKIGPEIVGSSEEDDMSNITMVDHLTPSKH